MHLFKLFVLTLFFFPKINCTAYFDILLLMYLFYMLPNLLAPILADRSWFRINSCKTFKVFSAETYFCSQKYSKQQNKVVNLTCECRMHNLGKLCCQGLEWSPSRSHSDSLLGCLDTVRSHTVQYSQCTHLCLHNITEKNREWCEFMSHTVFTVYYNLIILIITTQ